MQLNDLRMIICLKKSKVSLEGILVCKVIEKLLEQCSYTIGSQRSIAIATMEIPNVGLRIGRMTS